MNARSSLVVCLMALFVCLALVAQGARAQMAEDCTRINFNDFNYKPPEGKTWFEACQECCQRGHHDVGNFVGGAQCQCSMNDPDFSS